MSSSINLFSNRKGELNRFLSKFYNTNMQIYDKLSWSKKYDNPIEMTDLIGVFIDNNENFKINFWVCLDNNIYIQISNKNANELIKYIYERYPNN